MIPTGKNIGLLMSMSVSILTRQIIGEIDSLFLRPLRQCQNYDAGIWRLARAVEEARLESVYTGNRIEGSNPSVSASGRRSFSEGDLCFFIVSVSISGDLRRTQSAS